MHECAVKTALPVLLVVALLAPVPALADEQPDEKVLVGQVQTIDQSGAAITLTDGTRLLAAPGAMLQQVEEGMRVIAVYREQENGDKVLIRLSEPSRLIAPTENPPNRADFWAPCLGLPHRSPVIFGAVCA